jgi:translation initiation factor IF-3
VNHRIRVPEVRVVAEDGSNLGVLSTEQALRRAQEAGLDLVEVNPKAVPPVCKILDFGKFKYEEKKKNIIVKEN